MRDRRRRGRSRPASTELARRRAHAAVAAIKGGIDRGQLENIVAEPPHQHVDLVGAGPVVHP